MHGQDPKCSRTVQDVSHTDNIAQFGEEKLSSHFSVFIPYSFQPYNIWIHFFFLHQNSCFACLQTISCGIQNLIRSMHYVIIHRSNENPKLNPWQGYQQLQVFREAICQKQLKHIKAKTTTQIMILHPGNFNYIIHAYFTEYTKRTVCEGFLQLRQILNSPSHICRPVKVGCKKFNECVVHVVFGVF